MGFGDIFKKKKPYKPEDEGKVIVVWKKTKDGWKMHRDMFSSNHAPQQ